MGLLDLQQTENFGFSIHFYWKIIGGSFRTISRYISHILILKISSFRIFLFSLTYFEARTPGDQLDPLYVILLVTDVLMADDPYDIALRAFFILPKMLATTIIVSINEEHL